MGKISAALPAQTAGDSTSTTMLGTVQDVGDDGETINAALLVAPAGASTVTGAATNNVTFNFRQLRAGSSLGTVASITLVSGSNLVAETPLSVPLTAALQQVKEGDVIDVQMVQNSSGLAVGAGVVAQIETV